MSHPLSRHEARSRLGCSVAVALALLVAAVAGAAAGATGALPTILSALGAIVGLDWPRWIHNLADLLQIGTAVIAFLAWETARRGRR